MRGVTDNRLSGTEGLMWRLGKDPRLSSTIANITILDRPPDTPRFLRTMERACRVIPRLRQRVQRAPIGFGPASWVDDRSFDVRNHVRWVTLPVPATQDDLNDFAMVVMATPFDRSRPLWEFVVVEGLDGGRAALVQKVHHAVTDGEGGMRLSLEFLDVERDAPERAPVEADAPTRGDTSELDVVADLIADSIRLPLDLLREMQEIVADPTRLPRAGVAMADAVLTILSELTATDRARSPLWTARSLARAYLTIDVPLEPVRAAAKALGATVNAAFITAAAAAAGAYHRRHDRPIDELRASMAVSTRHDGSGANAFSLARLVVPTGVMPMGERLGLVAAAATQAKDSARTGALDVLGTVATSLPTPLLTELARTHAQTVDFATSNVRAAPVALYVAGARVVANYPVGPLLGVAFNATMMSYCGSLGVGLHCDTAAVTEPQLLAAEFGRAFDELAGVAR